MTKALQEKALEILKKEVDNRNFKDINYIIYLTSYLSNSKEEVSNYTRHIKKSINFLEKNFDETYLLLFELKNSIKVFNENQNYNFLFFIDYLIVILNENDLIKYSDKLTNLKGKVELGYSRYFKQKKNLVKEFKSNIEFQIYTQCDFQISFNLILRNLIELKETKSKKLNLELKKYEIYFEHFPKEIYNNKNNYILEIEKSLYHNLEFETLDFKKQKTKLKDLNNPLSAVLILDLI